MAFLARRDSISKRIDPATRERVEHFAQRYRDAPPLIAGETSGS